MLENLGSDDIDVQIFLEEPKTPKNYMGAVILRVRRVNPKIFLFFQFAKQIAIFCNLKTKKQKKNFLKLNFLS